MSTIEMCKKYYGTADIYKIFGVSKNSSTSQIQKAYHSLSLDIHPDRVTESERRVATQKFQILSKLYAVLTNKEKKKIFDENGIIKEDTFDNALPLPTFVLTSAHIETCKQAYTGSDLEKAAIRQAYMEKGGNIKYIVKRVPFLTEEDEERVIGLLKEWIESGQMPNYLNK